MTDDYKTIRAPEAAVQQAQDARIAHELTWGEFLQAGAEALADDPPADTAPDVVSVGAVRDELQQESITHDDIKTACVAAVEEALPPEVARGR
jgi:hypothetical protein